MTLNGGLIGCGYIANQQMAAWAQVRGGAITAVCDIDEAKARDMAERFGVEVVHTDYTYHGTATCLTPCSGQSTRGMRACRCVWYWQVSRCRQTRSS